MLVTVASFYESALQRKGYSFDGKNIKHNIHTISSNEKANNNSPDKYEMNQMNQMNQLDNNNETDQEVNEKKLEQKDEKSGKDLSADIFLKVLNLYESLIFDTSPSFSFSFSFIFYYSGFLSKIVLCFAYGSNSRVLLSVEKANEVY